MRRAAKVDANHREIVDALRRIGAGVQSLAGVGNGVPDLLVYFRGAYRLLEVKDGSKAPSKRKLTPDQVAWIEQWPGPVQVVCSVDDAFSAVGVEAKGR